MSRPTILIGIGSGGLRSIEAAWKLSQEIQSPEDRPNVQYIYLETDAANEPISDEIVKSPLLINNIPATKHAIEQDTNVTSEWINGQAFPTNIFSGAGGSPVVGRISLWDDNNRQTFINNLYAAQRKLTEKDVEKNKYYMVYVVGSFGGGTGSGVFLDIAYIIRDTLANLVELQGLFMIPNLGHKTNAMYSNTICCLKELDYYNDVHHAFPFKWTANPPKGFEKENTPYDLVQIISASYGTANIGIGASSISLPPVTYSELHEEAGIFLYLNALGMYDTRRTSLIDYADIASSKYTTFGLAAIHYPESDIKEIEANSLASEFLDRLIDREQYYDTYNRQECTISQSNIKIRNDIRNSFSSRFVEIIERWSTQISIAHEGQNVPVESHLRTLAEYLSSSDFSNHEKWDKLYGLFSVGGEYYRQLKNLCETAATDQVICLIIDEVRNTLNYYHNLHVVANYALDEIEETVKRILSFWHANGYTPVPQDWNKMLKDKLDKEVLPMPFHFKLMIEQQRLYYDRLMYNILYGMAMHIFSDSLVYIHKALKGEQDAAGHRIQMAVSTTGAVMPAKWRLTELMTVIENVSAGVDAKYRSCKEVSDKLKQKLSKNSCGNIWYIYPDGNLDNTLKTVDMRFRADYGQERSIKDITGNDDLYTFIFSITGNRIPGDVRAEQDLYGKVVPAYISKINLGQFSVSDAINGNDYSDRIKQVANTSLIPHVPINPHGRAATFVEYKDIPHILGGYDGEDGSVLSDISNKLSQIGIHNYQIRDAQRNKFSHIGLRNWLVFYQEFGRMSDQKGFDIIHDLADFDDYVAFYVSDRRGSGFSSEEYHKKRMPYISFSDCQKHAMGYINDAMSKAQDGEYEEAEKCYKDATYWDMTNETVTNKLVEIHDILEHEDTSSKFDRYYIIASRYMKQQDYNTARMYYKRADKVQPKDSNVLAKIKEIDTIYEQVRGFINQGNMLRETANALYDAVIFKDDIMKRPECIAAYKKVLDCYRQAQNLSKFDKDVENQIRNIERRLANINE